MHGVSSTEIPALLASYDFSGFDTIVDVGGGDGTLLTAILDQEARPRGVIYDLEHALDSARRRLAGTALAQRVDLVAGSFFDSVPKGGDAYLLKHIVHDWSDQDAVRILRNCRTAMSAGDRLLIVECVLEPGNAPHFGKFLDLEMIAITEGGRERTREELAVLLEAAGFGLSQVVATGAPTSVIEARPVG